MLCKTESTRTFVFHVLQGFETYSIMPSQEHLEPVFSYCLKIRSQKYLVFYAKHQFTIKNVLKIGDLYETGLYTLHLLNKIKKILTNFFEKNPHSDLIANFYPYQSKSIKAGSVTVYNDMIRIKHPRPSFLFANIKIVIYARISKQSKI